MRHERCRAANPIDTRPVSPAHAARHDLGVRAPEEGDRAFLERLQGRERGALSRFYELYFDRLYGYVRRMLGDDHAAEDLTQDIFLQLQRSFATYDVERELAPWVFAIAANKVRDHWRSRQRRAGEREVSFDEDPEFPFAPADAGLGPLPQLAESEIRSILSRAIDDLPHTLRETFVMRWHEELDFADIGRVVGRDETAVRKRYSRALGALREALTRHVGPAGERS